MDQQAQETKDRLSVHEAALLLAGGRMSLEDAEKALSHAIDREELPASIMRWASEQWDGERLEGNIDRTRTLIERRDFERWVERNWPAR